MNIDEYIKSRVDDQINWYSKKSQHAQKCYKRFQLAEIVMAASIPLLTGYVTSNKIIPIIIGILGASITIVESVAKLNKYHENWIQYRSTCEMLKYHKHLYLTETYPYNLSDETIENTFIRNIEDIISSENSQWKINASDKNNGNSSKN